MLRIIIFSVLVSGTLKSWLAQLQSERKCDRHLHFSKDGIKCLVLLYSGDANK